MCQTEDLIFTLRVYPLLDLLSPLIPQKDPLNTEMLF